MPLCGHRPWEAPESILADAGVELDGNYPNPIISLEKSENLVRLQTVLLSDAAAVLWTSSALLCCHVAEAKLVVGRLFCTLLSLRRGRPGVYTDVPSALAGPSPFNLHAAETTLHRSSQGIEHHITCRAAMQVVHACSVIEQSLAWGHAAPKVPYRPASYAGLSKNAPTPSSGAAATGSQLR